MEEYHYSIEQPSNDNTIIFEQGNVEVVFVQSKTYQISCPLVTKNSGDEEEDGVQRLESPGPVRGLGSPRFIEEPQIHTGVSRNPEDSHVEGDLRAMSSTPETSSNFTISEKERRAPIDSCWCDIPDMYVDPASRAAYYWMAVVTVAVIYNWIVIILRIAFEEMREPDFPGKVFSVLDTVSDVIYLMDIAIQSRTAYLEDGCLVTSLPETMHHYSDQPRFALDVLAVVPLNSLFYLSDMLPLMSFRSGLNDIISPALRILRLVKYPSVAKFFEKTDSRTKNPNLLRAAKLLVHLWLVIHWIGCFYYLISQYEGLGTNDWVYPNTEEFSAFSRKYVFCIYWSTMTLTTIGERPWPTTNVEFIFTGTTFLIGVFVFAAVVGNVGDVISNMHAARHNFQSRMDQIKYYLHHRHVPEDLQDQIKRWAEYSWARTKAIDENSMLQLLPSRLRIEVAIHVHLQTLKKVRIFEQCEEGLLRELVTKLRPTIHSPGEYICRIGEIGREMYIIDHGKVEILLPDPQSGQMKQVAIMLPGNYFGEISLLKLDDGQNRRTADVRSIGFSELLCLSRKDLMAALMEYPEAKKILENQARQRMKQSNTVKPTTPSAEAKVVPPAQAAAHRSAKAIFAEVIKHEGFSKLLSKKSNQEITEMRGVLKELKELKTQLSDTTIKQLTERCRMMEQQLQEKEQKLQHTLSQLLRQSKKMAVYKVSTSEETSPSESSLRTPVALSSDSTLTSPSIMERLPTPDIYMVQSAFAKPRRVLNAVSVLPPYDHKALAALHKRRRISPSSRARQSVEEDSFQPDPCNRAEGQLLQDPDSVLMVTQGGGGDDVAFSGVLKDPTIKDRDEEIRDDVPSVKKSTSDSSNCTVYQSPIESKTSVIIPLGPDAENQYSFNGIHSSVDPSEDAKILPVDKRLTHISSQSQPETSEAAKLADASSTSSQNTSCTDTSSNTSSSGGRGHSPKPAKPKPRYKRIERSETDTHFTINKAHSINRNKNRTVRTHSKQRGKDEVESCVSSEGFSACSTASNSACTDSFMSMSAIECSDGCLTNAAVQNTLINETSPKQNEPKRREHQTDDETEQLNKDNSDFLAKKFKSAKEDLVFKPITANEDIALASDASAKEENIMQELKDGHTGGEAYKIDEGFGSFIVATRVKSDFEKRISKADLTEHAPKVVTCRKIDDTQLSILLAKRREVNDCADYTVESQRRSDCAAHTVGVLMSIHAEHSHSVHSIVDSPEISPTLDSGDSRQEASIHKNESAASQIADTDAVICEEEVSTQLDVAAVGKKSRYSKVEFSIEQPSPPSSADETSAVAADGSITPEISGSTHFGKDALQSEINQICHADNSDKASQTNNEEGVVEIKKGGKLSPANGEKEKNYPVSILKKPKSDDAQTPCCLVNSSASVEQTTTANEADGTVESTSCTEGASSASNKAPSATDISATITKEAEDVKSSLISLVKDSEGEQSNIEYDPLICLSDQKISGGKKLRSRRSRNAALQVGIFPLKPKKDRDADTPEPPSNPSEAFGSQQDESSAKTLSQTGRQSTENEKEEENTRTLRRTSSASLYYERSADSAHDLNASPYPPTSSSVSSQKMASASLPLTTDNHSSSGRKHSEKLDFLIATFDSPKKPYMQEEIKSTVYRNSSFGHYETTIVRLNSEQAGKGKPGDQFKSKDLETECKPESPVMEAKSESKDDNKACGFPSTAPNHKSSQKRKPLRIRSLTKRPHEKENSKCDMSKEGSKPDSLVQNQENEGELISYNCEIKSDCEPSEGNSLKSNQPRNNLISASKEENAESGISSSPVSNQMGTNFTAQLYSNLVGEFDPLRNVPSSDCASSDILTVTSSESYRLNASQTDVLSISHKDKINSDSCPMSFKDKIQQAASRLKAKENSDKENSSTTMLRRSQSASPQDNTLSQSFSISYKPTDIVLSPPDLNQPKMTTDLLKPRSWQIEFHSSSASQDNYCLDQDSPKSVNKQDLSSVKSPLPMSCEREVHYEISLTDSGRVSLLSPSCIAESFESRSSSGTEGLQVQQRHADLASYNINSGETLHSDLGTAGLYFHSVGMGLGNDSTTKRSEFDSENSSSVLSAPSSEQPATQNTLRHTPVEIGSSREHLLVNVEDKEEHTMHRNDENVHENLPMQEDDMNDHEKPQAEQTSKILEREEEQGDQQPVVHLEHQPTAASMTTEGAGEDGLLVEELCLQSDVLNSAGVISSDESGEEEKAEKVKSLIRLADFGVDDNDEGALSDISTCADDHSDTDSDLDDLG